MRRTIGIGLILAAVLPPGGATGQEKMALPGRKASSSAVWQVQYGAMDIGLRGVFAISRDVAWASGSKGTFLRTTDGGVHWQVGHVAGAENLDFRDIQAFDADRACLLSAGRPAKIFRTTNAGGTWMEVYSNDDEGVFFDAFAFFDEKHGLAVGDPMKGRFMILATSDGGENWEEIPDSARPRAEEGESAFAASGTCLAVLDKDHAWFCTGGPSPRVFYSNDAGRTWKDAPSPLDLETPSGGGFSLVFVDRKDGVLVGGDYKNESGRLKTAAVSRDGGKTWTLIDRNGPSGFRECVALIPGTQPPLLVAVGPSGSDISIDKGRSWMPVPGPGFHSLSFSPKDGSGWAVGRDGLIARFDLQALLKLLKT